MVADISHVIDDTTGRFKSKPTTQQKKDKLLKTYTLQKNTKKKLPITWLNLATGKTAIVDITIHVKAGLDIDKDDYITFNHDTALFTVTYGKKKESTNKC